MIFHFNDLKVTNNLTYNLTLDSIPWFINTIFCKEKKLCYLCKDNNEIDFIQKNVKILNPNINIIKFPFWDFPLFNDISPSVSNQKTRINALTRLVNFKNENCLLLISLSALIVKIPPISEFKKNYMYVDKNNQNSSISNIKNFIINKDYKRVDTVREKFEYSIRGGIVDIFPSNLNLPVRLDYFGEHLDTIRVFDPISQLSKKLINSFYLFSASEISLKKESIESFRVNYRKYDLDIDKTFYETISNGQKIPGTENFLPFFFEKLDSILDLITDQKIIFNETNIDFFSSYFDELKKNYEKSKYIDFNIFNQITFDKNEVLKQLEKKKLIRISNFTNYSSQKSYKLISTKIPNFFIQNHKNQIEKFKNFVKENNNYTFLFSTKNSRSKERFMNLFDNITDLDKNSNISNSKLYIKNLDIFNGFKYTNCNGKGLIVVSDEDLFGKKKYFNTKKKVNAEKFFFEISNISEGDLVVHSEHGIGRFKGLNTIELHNQNHECIEVEYAGSDKLFIPIENLELISRYSSKDEEFINLDNLGSQNWQLRKANIKDKIKVIAHELINIAAKRAVKKGKVFFHNEDRFLTFSSKFDYAETSDQLNAVNDIVNDLESGRPMDRLICGDVGFGKTEVAMRAAYIVADNSFKVVMLCPTTLLVNQHYKNFLERFKDTDIEIIKISRIESQLQKKQIIEKLQISKKLIVIGTHAVLNDDFEYENLGLLIVDEEQSFGVEQKEKIKKLRSEIHVLTLTATPIPRTLQFSILGIKDLSLITTPPINRISIKTFICKDEDDIIKNAIESEVSRNGQIFYVTPKIKFIDQIKSKIKKIFPKLNIGIVHGRLPNHELIETYNQFYSKEIDILVSTSIIESGLDVSNANTIIIEKPNFFGLSQLYQIRGRVGRSNTQSYAYLMIDNFKDLSEKAKKRLDAISKLDSLGAGFQLASHDLDIRGSGNILGSEQSGHIKEVGVELYQKLIKDAISEIKNEKLSENEWSPQINLGIPFFIPKEYIPEIDIRLNIYRRISKTNNYEELKKILVELRDRFGKLPVELINLSKIIEIKNLSKKANIKKIDLGVKGFVIAFRENFKNYDKIINVVKNNSKNFKFRKDNKLSFINDWKDKKIAIEAISSFLKLIECE